jgi:hypothetical protein
MPAFLFSLLLPAALAAPAPMVAYLTPEEVLTQQESQFFPTPGTTTYDAPNPRTARALAEQRAQERLAQHPDLYHDPNIDGPLSSSSSSAAAVSSASSAPAHDAAASSVSSSSLDPVMLRLLMRLERNTAQTTNTNSVIQQQAQPLTPSGPEGPAVVIVMLAAVAATVLRAKHVRGWRFF